MSHARKAFAAFFVALFALPVADWIGGGQAFSWGTLLAGVIAAAIAGLTVYNTPNAL